MANDDRGAIGYVLVGIADNKADAEKVEKAYHGKSKTFGGFYITGVSGEVSKHYASADEYLKKVVAGIRSQPVADAVKAQIVRNVRLVRYFDKEVLVFRIEAGEDPCAFDEKYFERHGNEVSEVKGAPLTALFRRFLARR